MRPNGTADADSASRLTPTATRRRWAPTGRRSPCCPALVLRLRCIDGSGGGSIGSPPYPDSRRDVAIRSPGDARGSGGCGSASFCASFLGPNSRDFFSRRHFRVFPACSAFGRRLYRQGSPNAGYLRRNGTASGLRRLDRAARLDAAQAPRRLQGISDPSQEPCR